MPIRWRLTLFIALAIGAILLVLCLSLYLLSRSALLAVKGALLTKDLVPLEPKVSEYKLYARDVGPVLTVKTSGGSGREELISFSQAG